MVGMVCASDSRDPRRAANTRLDPPSTPLGDRPVLCILCIIMKKATFGFRSSVLVLLALSAPFQRGRGVGGGSVYEAALYPSNDAK